MKKTPYMITLVALSILKSAGALSASEVSDSQAKITKCPVSCLKPTILGDGDRVLEVLTATTRALAEHDFTSLANYLDINCTTYNETTRKLVVGRDNIIDDVKKLAYAEERKLQAPAVAYVIDHPYVKVDGDQAVATFVLIKEIGGPKPTRFESHISDVFIKRDGDWKKLHFLGETWKEVRPAGRQ